jgi:hypothetical protein
MLRRDNALLKEIGEILDQESKDLVLDRKAKPKVEARSWKEECAKANIKLKATTTELENVKGPPESKTLRPILRFLLLAWQDYMTTCRWSAGCMCQSPGGRPCPPYIGRRTRSVDWSPGRLQQGNLSLVDYKSCHILLIYFWAKSTDVLSCLCTPSLELVVDHVVWGIFWKVFRRSCGLPTRSVGSTDRSAGILVGRTHLSGTAVRLVGGDPGVPMSHKPPSEVLAQRP